MGSFVRRSTGAQQFRHVGVGHDGLRHRPEHRVASSVVPVVVSVDHRVEPALTPARHAFQENRRRVGKLRVDRHKGVGRGEPADAAPAAGEEADVAAQRTKLRDRRRRPDRHRGALG
jgi:hypothetical protein